MNKTFKLLSLLFTCLFAAACSSLISKSSKDYTQYVNPFIGANDNGHTFPGATTPFGMIQTSPVTGAIGWRYCSEYVYNDTIIWGFTQTHLNGTGCMDLGDILVMPISGKKLRDNEEYRSSFDKKSEKATPGYYSVELKKENVKVELTATTHVALHRYTFNSPDSSSVLIDLQHGPAWNEDQYHSQVKSCEVKWENSHTLSGHVKNSVWVDQDYFFVIEFNHPVNDTLSLPMLNSEKGKRIVASFELDNPRELLMKIALSTTSVDGAKKNLSAELSDWDFNKTKEKAHDTWNSYLSRIDVKGTKEEKTNFYTSFYHSLIQPNEISDVDGLYRNANDSIVKAESGKFYSTFSLWDTYRAAHPFYTLFVPEKVDGFVNSLIEQGEVQGFLPIWSLWGKENYCMIGNHAVAVIAEAYLKGFKGFDENRAFDIIYRTQTVSHKPKTNWENYLKYGYLPTDLTQSESVSSTLEFTYDDYATSLMAKKMNKEKEADYFKKRSDFYKNLFDSQTNFMRPKNADRSWKTPFNPSDVAHAESNGGDYTEGNAWQYTWHVQHDIPGLIKLFGGKDRFISKLDSFFTMKLQTNQADVTGLIGQYAHGNEPSHHVSYLYTLAGKPQKTQELIRNIFDTMYRPTPDGLSGNDDCGQMSAWYMFSAMGFYPVNPVSCNYVFGAPQLTEMTLNLGNGKKLHIKAEGLSKENKYIDFIVLNGKRYTKNYISHEDILKGGNLIYKMTNEKKIKNINNN